MVAREVGRRIPNVHMSRFSGSVIVVVVGVKSWGDAA
jgi:hypothetical protein